jgi:hypothetical protein
MKIAKYNYKLPRLSKEEFRFFLKINTEFFKRFDLQLSLYRKIASALQTFAVAKLVGKGYGGIQKTNKEEAIRHHLKACKYNPYIAVSHPNFRKAAGLLVYKEQE